MTNEEAKLTIDYLKSIQDGCVDGEGFDMHPLPEWYALDKAIEQIEQTRWIPVSERLPEENGGYLVTVMGAYVTTALWVGNAENWSKITAWMPLPKPYKAEMESD